MGKLRIVVKAMNVLLMTTAGRCEHRPVPMYSAVRAHMLVRFMHPRYSMTIYYRFATAPSSLTRYRSVTVASYASSLQ